MTTLRTTVVLCLASILAACSHSPPAKDARAGAEGTAAYAMVRHPVSGVEVPRIALPQRPDVEQAVNQELDSVAADLQCDPDTGGEFTTTVRVTHAANDVLSVSIRASIWCDGLAHPTLDADLSRTFDLETGRVVSFRELFDDYERDFETIAEAYLAALPEDREECADVHTLETLESYGFGYTLATQGLTVKPEFPHVIETCSEEVIIPFDRVRALATREGILERVADAAR